MVTENGEPSIASSLHIFTSSIKKRFDVALGAENLIVSIPVPTPGMVNSLSSAVDEMLLSNVTVFSAVPFNDMSIVFESPLQAAALKVTLNFPDRFKTGDVKVPARELVPSFTVPPAAYPFIALQPVLLRFRFPEAPLPDVTKELLAAIILKFSSITGVDLFTFRKYPVAPGIELQLALKHFDDMEEASIGVGAVIIGEPVSKISLILTPLPLLPVLDSLNLKLRVFAVPMIRSPEDANVLLEVGAAVRKLVADQEEPPSVEYDTRIEL